MDLIELIGGMESHSPLQKRYKKNLPKVKKVLKALTGEFPVTILYEGKRVKILNILEAEPYILDILRLYEEEAKVIAKVYKRHI